MPHKKVVFVTYVLVFLIGLAAFVAGRMFNKSVNPVASDEPLAGGPGFTFSSTNNITPAAELPTTLPEVTGLYVERHDHIMIIQVVSFDQVSKASSEIQWI
jgi:hypothetical protein